MTSHRKLLEALRCEAYWRCYYGMIILGMQEDHAHSEAQKRQLKVCSQFTPRTKKRKGRK